jgi:hypothetical protein
VEALRQRLPEWLPSGNLFDEPLYHADLLERCRNGTRTIFDGLPLSQETVNQEMEVEFIMLSNPELHQKWQHKWKLNVKTTSAAA